MLSSIFHMINHILEGEILQACYQKHRSDVSTLLSCPALLSLTGVANLSSCCPCPLQDEHSSLVSP